ncbi:MAG: protein phosphatase 2C domain-containing protein [Marinobacter sp.]|uniref:PP2C family protein-serine/threonine phosphatase n=1 Tax=Marinobacter sp. TaxID=50741 RepID=UPI00299D4944|nr:protein phosphatase 2C domain-containing protein [Marinobacter sp.]MDX1634403.1 protein phosphatase 2C domain-containing protein [Marinobacter sp.]
MKLMAAGRTDVGCRRKNNQDAIAWRLNDTAQTGFALVADGMGGYEGGGIASRLATEAVVDCLEPLLGSPPTDDAAMEMQLQDAISAANERIIEARAGQPELSKMGTTLVVAWVHHGRAHLAHLGDSRCYRVRDDGLEQRTRDDTVVQNMVDDGSITPEEAPRVPFRNVLTRALGSSNDAGASFDHFDMAAGERLLLCSDGLPEAVPESEWLAHLKADPDLDSQARRLVDASLDNQAPDNVSVVLIQTSP